jgi:hypothetical protein
MRIGLHARDICLQLPGLIFDLIRTAPPLLTYFHFRVFPCSSDYGATARISDCITYSRVRSTYHYKVGKNTLWGNDCIVKSIPRVHFNLYCFRICVFIRLLQKSLLAVPGGCDRILFGSQAGPGS